MLIWDNRCTLHRGTGYDYARYKRDLRRANVNESGEERSAVPVFLIPPAGSFREASLTESPAKPFACKACIGMPEKADCLDH